MFAFIRYENSRSDASHQTVPSTFSISERLKFRKSKENLPCKGSYTTSIPSLIVSDDDTNRNEKPYTITALFIPRVMIAAVNYASLSLVDISFRAIQPLFFSTPIHLGGLGLPPPTIGTILSCFGVLNGVLCVFFFAKIHDRWGTKKVFVAGIASAIPVFVTFPILSAMARAQGLSTMVWCGVAIQVFFSVFLNLSYGELTTPSFGLVSSCHYPVVLNSFACLNRVHIYLYHCCVSQPSFPWWHKWTLSMRRLDHACIWTSCCQLSVLAFYAKRLSRRLACLLCSHMYSMHGFGPV